MICKTNPGRLPARLAVKSPISKVVSGPYWSLTEKALSILRRPGIVAHVYLPGANGAAVSGLLTNNYTVSTGSTGYSAHDGVAGLVLDGMGEVGEELVTNGTFEDATGWTLGAGWSVSDGTLNHTSAVYEYATTLTGAVFTTSSTYRVRFTQISGGSVDVFVKGGSATAASGAGEKEVFVVAASSGTGLRFGMSGAACVIDNVSCVEVTGIHATQTTTANKPAVRRGLLNLLTQSHTLNNVSWVLANLGVGVLPVRTVNYAEAPDGTMTACRLQFNKGGGSTTGDTSEIYHSATISATDMMTRAVWIKSLSGDVVMAVGASGSITVTSEWQLVPIPSITAERFRIMLRGGQAIPHSDTADVLVWSCGLFSGALTSQQIIDAGGIPLTTSAAASNPNAGRYWWGFDGTDSLVLGSVPFQMADDHCVIAAVAAGGAGATYPYAFALGSGGAGGQLSAALLNANGTLQYRYKNDASTTFALTVDASYTGEATVASLVKVGSTATARNNGAVVSSASPTGATTVSTAVFGNSYGAGGSSWQGPIGPVIAIKGTLTDADLLTLERWVASLTPNGPVF